MPEISAYCPGCGRSVYEQAALPRANDLQESLLGTLAYLTIIPAIILLLIPTLKGIRFVRFHAWQSILYTLASIVIGVALRIIFVAVSVVPVVGFLFAWLLAGVVSLALVMLWVVLVIKALQGEAYEIPWLGHFAARFSA